MLVWAKKDDMKYGGLIRKETSVSRFIPYTRHIDETTLKTKENYLLKIIKIDGLPFETADQIDINQNKNIRSTLLRGLSNSRFAIYHHIIRRETHEALDGFFESPWCDALDKAYQSKLSKKRMFVNEQYLTIVRRPAQSKMSLVGEISRTLFSKVDHDLADHYERQSHAALNEAVSHILTSLSPYKPRVLGINQTDKGNFSEVLSFLSYLINFEKADIRLPYGNIADYLGAKRLSFGKETLEVRGAAPDDVKLGAILSIKEYADATGPGMLDGLLRLPHEFIVTQSFGFVDRQAALSSMKETKRKLIAGEEGATSIEEEMDHAIDDLASGRSSFGEHHLSVTVIAKTPSELDRAVSESHSSFVNLGIVTTREDIALEPSFWAQLPGNFSYIARRSLISNRNFASFASLHNFPVGKKSANHWGEAITKLETTSGTPYWFNFHERDVGNFTVIGPVGTGKTVLLTFLHAQAQRLKPKSVYFDKDRGAEIYLRAIGADYTVVSRGRKTGLNPLQLPDTAENRAFLKEWLRLLVRIDNKIPLTPEDNQMIADAVNATYELPSEHRRLSVLSELLRGHERQHGNSLANRISMWHGQGERSWLFDNVEDTLELGNRTIGFDLTSILDDPISRTPWLMYIFHKINGLLDGSKVMIMLDEGWKLLDDPEFSQRIKDWLKTIRKQNGIVGFATQSARDAIESQVGDSIIEQSPTQIFLPNARASAQDYCDGFGLSQHELEIIRELSPSSHCFLLRHGNDSVIARLDLRGLDDFIAVLSGRTESVHKMEELIGLYGSDPDKWLPHFTNWKRTSI